MECESSQNDEGGESVCQKIMADYPFMRTAKMKTPKEHFRPGELLASRINSGDLSMVSDHLKPIIESGSQNGGVQFVELNPWESCPIHIVMVKPLLITIDECQKPNHRVEYFRYTHDPHFALPDLDCFRCTTTGEIVAFPLTKDAWSN